MMETCILQTVPVSISVSSAYAVSTFRHARQLGVLRRADRVTSEGRAAEAGRLRMAGYRRVSNRTLRDRNLPGFTAIA